MMRLICLIVLIISSQPAICQNLQQRSEPEQRGVREPTTQEKRAFTRADRRTNADLNLTNAQKNALRETTEDWKKSRDRLISVLKKARNRQEHNRAVAQLRRLDKRAYEAVSAELRSPQVRELDRSRKSVSDALAPVAGIQKWPTDVLACYALCEVTCNIVLPSGGFCDCSFCLVLIVTPW